MNGEGKRLGQLALVSSHLGLAVLAAAMGYLLGIRKGKVSGIERGEGEEAQGAVVVSTVLAARGPMERTLRLTGTIAPKETVVVVPKLAGKIVRLEIEEGSRVMRGRTLLAEIEHRELDAQKKVAEAGIDVARAQLSQIDVNLEQARRDLERVRSLHVEGGASAEMLEKAQAGVNSLFAQKKVVQAQIKQLEANLALMDLRIRDARIVSPASGVVTNLHDLDVGDTVAPGMPFCEIAELTRVRGLLAATEDHLAALKGGERVRLEPPALAGKTFTGVVDKLPQTLDPRTRTGLVEVGVGNERGLLRPGMFVRASVVVEERRDSLAVPESALVSRGGRTVVYILREGKVKEKEVRPGLRASGTVEIVEGLAEGDEVVTGGVKMLSDGTSVKVEER